VRKSVLKLSILRSDLNPLTHDRSGNPSSHSHTHSQTLITLQSGASLQSTLEFAQSRIDKIIADKLDQFFEMGWEEFDWTPKLSETVMKARLQAAASSSATVQPAPASSGGFMSGAFAGAMGFGSNQGNSRPASPGPGLRPQSVLASPGLKRQSTMVRFRYFDADTKREPSTYLFEMITFLTAYVDSVLIGLREDVRGRAYRGALEHVRDGLLVRLVDHQVYFGHETEVILSAQNLLVTQDIPKANEQAFKNLLDDIEFVEREMGSLGLDEAAVGLGQVFGEIKGVRHSATPVKQISRLNFVGL
jgi:hypothetical protein